MEEKGQNKRTEWEGKKSSKNTDLSLQKDCIHLQSSSTQKSEAFYHYENFSWKLLCCPHNYIPLKKKYIVLQQYILNIVHKIRSFLPFSAFSHTSSLYPKFKALLIEKEQGEWDRSESEPGDAKRRRQEQPWHSTIGDTSVSCWKSPVGATEIHQCPEWLVTWGLHRTTRNIN